MAPLLTQWSSFYGIVATSAATLVGLMFVVITLVTGAGRRSTNDGISTFSTPTIVHFGAVLFVSAVLVAPWHALGATAWMLALTGVFGIVYMIRVIVLASRSTVYRPDGEDWAWYSILPIVAYVTVLVGGIALVSWPWALYVVGAAVMLLIFIGIHNAWDIVTYLAIGLNDDDEKKDEPG